MIFPFAKLYPRQTKFEEGILESACRRSVRPLQILRRELLPQFFTNSHEIWHKCLPWDVDVQDIFFDSGRKCVAMVTAYGIIGGKSCIDREPLPQFFTNSHEIWHRCLPWGVDVQDGFFDSGRKCVAMVTTYYAKNSQKTGD